MDSKVCRRCQQAVVPSNRTVCDICRIERERANWRRKSMRRQLAQVGPRKSSTVLGRRGDVFEYFLAKVHVDDPDACWQWTGAVSLTGYGMFTTGRLHDPSRSAAAHRWAYEHYRGPIPAGMQLDHLCRNRGCVNPWHLEPVTSAENNRRAREAA